MEVKTLGKFAYREKGQGERTSVMPLQVEPARTVQEAKEQKRAGEV